MGVDTRVGARKGPEAEAGVGAGVAELPRQIKHQIGQ
jgi:hypothetical protein